MQPIISAELEERKPDREEPVRRIIHVDMDAFVRHEAHLERRFRKM